MSIEISTNNVQQFINDFEELYLGDRSLLFELLEGNIYSLQEKKAIFDGLSEWKDKAKFYNLMTSSSRTELYDYIGNTAQLQSDEKYGIIGIWKRN